MRYRSRLIYVPLFLLFGFGQNVQAASTDPVRDAIVKIYTIHNRPDYYNPWSMQGPRSSTGSGCIIEGRKILTNAHVVSDQTFIQVRRHGTVRRVQAKVVRVSHAADLAILTVEDPDFFEGVEPLSIGTLPASQDEVVVYGFPMGGDTLSITKGVISRIEHQTYSHSSVYLLAGQIDAAINPGNSGGPVLKDDEVVGVVMQAISNAENLGYMVPVNVVRHFMKDLEDGQHDGFPSLGVVLQDMENPSHRARAGMQSRDTGVLITRLLLGSSVEGVLEPGDVLLSVGGLDVADDGTVEFRPRERTSLSYAIQQKQIGEELEFTYLRQGTNQSAIITLNRSVKDDWLIPMQRYDVLPEYYIYGGVVFCPLTKNLLMAWGKNWYNAAPKEWVALLGENFVTEEREDVVIALKVLAADINQGYHEYRNLTISSVNGSSIRNLEELVDAVESADSEYIEFESDSGKRLVFDREKVEQADANILDTYRVSHDRSEHLRTTE